MLLGSLLALSAGALFGFANVMGRIAISRSSVYTTAVWSLLPSSVVLPFVVALLALNGRIGWQDIQSIPFFVGAGICIDFGARLSLVTAVRRLGAARAVAFRLLAPLVSLTAGFLILGEEFPWVVGLGVALMLVGIATIQSDALQRERHAAWRAPVGPVPAAGPAPTSKMSGAPGTLPEGTEQDVGSQHPRSAHADFSVRSGVVYGVIAGLAFGVGDVFRKAGVSTGGHPLFGTLVTTVTGLCLYVLVGLPRGLVRKLRPDRRSYLYLAAVGISILCAVSLFLTALQYIPVGIGSTLSGTQILFAMLFGWLINQAVEQVSMRVVLGGCTTFLGFVLVIAG